MLRQAKSNLLKEYSKTLIITEPLFPTVQPREWGHEFSRLEMETIYADLKFAIKTANPQPRKLLLEEFNRIEDPNVNLHWFLFNFWSEIAVFLVKPTNPIFQYELMAQ